MPRIVDDYLNGSVYLYRSRFEAEQAINIGGSGFLVNVSCEHKNLPPPWGFGYIVTNRHVIEAGACCMRINMTNGGFDVFEYQKDNWILSLEDDLAICAIPQLSQDKYILKGLPREQLLTEQIMKDHNFGVGDEVVLIGRFVNQEGKERNLPSVRFGNISQMPIEPIEYDGRMQDSFLCEIKSIGGFSGSPVFLAPVSRVGRPNGVPALKKTMLLGIDWAHIQNWETARDDRGIELPHIRFPSNTGMMAVVPAWKLDRMLDHPILKEQRLRLEDMVVRQRSAPKVATDIASDKLPLPSVVPPASDENTNHREDFMRLVGAAARKPAQED
jgi:hypothetical protein